MVKGKSVQNISLALKAKKESSDEDSSNSDNKDEEYAKAVRDFKKYFKRRGRFLRQPQDEKKECPKLSRNFNQRTFIGGSWSDSSEEGEENTKDKKCLMKKASNEENEVHKFSDGTLKRVLHKLDYMVKDFRQYQYNPTWRIESGLRMIKGGVKSL
nr:alpha/beta hydrolases superfamily protein [Tanacetum cinerariifolium]